MIWGRSATRFLIFDFWLTPDPALGGHLEDLRFLIFDLRLTTDPALGRSNDF
jgi:hypothetical protein